MSFSLTWTAQALSYLFLKAADSITGDRQHSGEARNRLNTLATYPRQRATRADHHGHPRFQNVGSRDFHPPQWWRLSPRLLCIGEPSWQATPGACVGCDDNKTFIFYFSIFVLSPSWATALKTDALSACSLPATSRTYSRDKRQQQVRSGQVLRRGMFR